MIRLFVPHDLFAGAALSRLARDKVIGFAEKGRRDVQIPDVGALTAFVQRCLAPAPAMLQ